MKIGMIVAIPEEIEQLLSSIGTPLGTDHLPGYDIFLYQLGAHRLFIAPSGAGEIAASATTQLLITRYEVDCILNFGVVGGLVPEMKLQQVSVIEKIVHYDYDASPFDHSLKHQYPGYPDIFIPADEALLALALEAEPSLRPVICASADKFVADPAAKAELHRLYGAQICEMESAGIALTARRCGVPCLFIKAVSDSVEGGAEEFAAMVSHAAAVCVRVLLKLLNLL